ncbi:hypothetical protein GbCGDNIH2_7056 [Granulibacter bethesdensis]|nr:hypothetical protein GbCGDNIH2_7056 [Granulibacter bethesdensis]
MTMAIPVSVMTGQHQAIQVTQYCCHRHACCSPAAETVIEQASCQIISVPHPPHPAMAANMGGSMP